MLTSFGFISIRQASGTQGEAFPPTPFLWLRGVGFYLAGTDAHGVLQAPWTGTSGLPGGNIPLPGSSAAPSGPESGMLWGPSCPGAD